MTIERSWGWREDRLGTKMDGCIVKHVEQDGYHFEPGFGNRWKNDPPGWYRVKNREILRLWSLEAAAELARNEQEAQAHHDHKRWQAQLERCNERLQAEYDDHARYASGGMVKIKLETLEFLLNCID